MAGHLGSTFDQSLLTEPPPEVAGEEPPAEPVAPPTGSETVEEEPEPAYFAEEVPGAEPQPEPSPEAWVDAAVEPSPYAWDDAAAEPSLNGEAQADIDPVPEQWTEAAEARSPEQSDDPENSSPFPIRRPLYKRPEPPPTAEEELTTTIAFLQRLQVTIQRVEAAAEVPAPAALGLTVLQAKRIARTGITPDPFEIGVLPKPWTPPPSPLEFTPEADPLAGLPPAAAPLHLRASHAVWLVLIGGLCFVTLGLVAYLWTRVLPLSRLGAAPRNAVAHGPPAPEVSEDALKFANLALEAIQHNDLKRASAILAAAQKQGVVLPGLFYQAGLLALDQGQPDQADDFLDRSIAAKDLVAECWYLRANAAFFKEGPSRAAEDFAEAINAAPFSPRYYFFRAECLRRFGSAAAALTQFQEALRRRPNSADSDLILFKIGLTKIEANTDLIFKTELHDRLAQEPVAGDTLLLAAAEAISRRDYPEAADYFRRAALVLPPRVFQSRARDYVFQLQAKQPEIAAVLKVTLPTSGSNQPAPPRAAHVLIDPATRTLAEADPAGW